jgi:hypothetical protein
MTATSKRSKPEKSLEAQLEIARTQLENTRAELETTNEQVFALLKEKREHKCDAANKHLDNLLAQYTDPAPAHPEEKASRSSVGVIFVIFLLFVAAAVVFIGYRINRLETAKQKQSERIEQLERLDLGERVKQLESTVEETQQPTEGQ